MVWLARAISAVLLALALAVPSSMVAEAAIGSASGDGAWNGVPATYWAHAAIDYVASDRSWMRDFGADTFHPERAESRRLFARALVRAFAKGALPQQDTTFVDLTNDDRFYPYAAVVVERGWMTAPGRVFDPRGSVTTRDVHIGLVLALGLRAEASGLRRLHMADGTRLNVPRSFGTLLLGMVLGLRFNHDDEASEVGPSTPLPRSEVAYSLWRAHQAATVSTWKLDALAPYADIELPDLRASARRIVEFGARYVGYPYVWSGEWATATSDAYCCGSQPVGGFDCSGIVWWTMKAADDGYDNTLIRGYAGWSLPQRSSADMAAVGEPLTYTQARPGDLLFFDGNTDGIVDHASIYLGRGWALDSSSSYAGVSIIRVGGGWYREHFVHPRRIVA